MTPLEPLAGTPPANVPTMSRKTFAGLAAGFFLLDVLTKLAAWQMLPLHQEVKLIPGCFSLRLTTNPGIAFSMLAGYDSVWKTILLTAAAVVALFYIGWLFHREAATPVPLALGLSLVAGGILGNASNRVLTGSVIDFLDFYVGDFTWPTFNLADSFITIGAILVLWRIVFVERGGR